MVGVSARWDGWRQRMARMVRRGSRMCGGSRTVDFECTMDRDARWWISGWLDLGRRTLGLLGWCGFAHHARGGVLAVSGFMARYNARITELLGLADSRDRLC